MKKDQDIRFIGDLQRLDVRPGDRFVLTVPVLLSDEEVARLQEQWAKLGLGDGKVIVLHEGMKLGVIGSDPEPST